MLGLDYYNVNFEMIYMSAFERRYIYKFITELSELFYTVDDVYNFLFYSYALNKQQEIYIINPFEQLNSIDKEKLELYSVILKTFGMEDVYVDITKEVIQQLFDDPNYYKKFFIDEFDDDNFIAKEEKVVSYMAKDDEVETNYYIKSDIKNNIIYVMLYEEVYTRLKSSLYFAVDNSEIKKMAVEVVNNMPLMEVRDGQLIEGGKGIKNRFNDYYYSNSFYNISSLTMGDNIKKEIFYGSRGTTYFLFMEDDLIKLFGEKLFDIEVYNRTRLSFKETKIKHMDYSNARIMPIYLSMVGEFNSKVDRILYILAKILCEKGLFDEIKEEYQKKSKEYNQIIDDLKKEENHYSESNEIKEPIKEKLNLVGNYIAELSDLLDKRKNIISEKKDFILRNKEYIEKNILEDLINSKDKSVVVPKSIVEKIITLDFDELHKLDEFISFYDGDSLECTFHNFVNEILNKSLK